MDIASLLTGGSTAALGSIFGGVLGIFKGWQEHKHQLAIMELQSKERIADRTHELSVLDKEADRAIQVSTIEANQLIATGDQKALAASIYAENKGATWSAGWRDKLTGSVGGFFAGIIAVSLGLVDVIRGLFRPVAASFLMGVTTKMYLDLAARVGALDSMTSDQAFALYMQIVGMILFLTGTAVGWYFAARPTSQIGRNQK